MDIKMNVPSGYTTDKSGSHVASSVSQADTVTHNHSSVCHAVHDEVNLPSTTPVLIDESVCSAKSTSTTRHLPAEQGTAISTIEPDLLGAYSKAPSSAEKPLMASVSKWVEHLVLVVDRNRSERTERELNKLDHELSTFVRVFGLSQASAGSCLRNPEFIQGPTALDGRHMFATLLIIHVVYEPFKRYEHCHEICELLSKADVAFSHAKQSIPRPNIFDSGCVMVEKDIQSSCGSTWEEFVHEDSYAASFGNTAPNGYGNASSALARGVSDMIHFKHKYLDQIHDTGISDKHIMMFGVFKVVQFYIQAKLAKRAVNISTPGSGVHQYPSSNSSKQSHAKSTFNAPKGQKRCHIEEMSNSDSKILGISGGDDNDPGDGDDTPHRPAPNPTPSGRVSCLRTLYSCILYLLDSSKHSKCAQKSFETIGGLASHMQEKHDPQVKCPECPHDEPARYRDNGRLKDHLRRKHKFDAEVIKHYDLAPIQCAHYKKGTMQNWEKMWNQFCPNQPYPKYKYQKPEAAQNSPLLEVGANMHMDDAMIDDLGDVVDTLKGLKGSQEIGRNIGRNMLNLTSIMGRVLGQVPKYRPIPHKDDKLHKRSKVNAPKESQQSACLAGVVPQPARNKVSYNPSSYAINNYGPKPPPTEASHSEFETDSLEVNDWEVDVNSCAPSQMSLQRRGDFPELGMEMGMGNLDNYDDCYLSPYDRSLNFDAEDNGQATLQPGTTGLGVQQFGLTSSKMTVDDNFAPTEQREPRTELSTGFTLDAVHSAGPSSLGMGNMATFQASSYLQPFDIWLIPCNQTINDRRAHPIESVEEPDGDQSDFWSAIHQQMRDIVLNKYGLYIGQYELLLMRRSGSGMNLVELKDGPSLMRARRLHLQGTPSNSHDVMEVMVKGIIDVLEASA